VEVTHDIKNLLYIYTIDVNNNLPYLLILLSLNLFFFPPLIPLLSLQQLYPKTLALNLHHICNTPFSQHINNIQ